MKGCGKSWGSRLDDLEKLNARGGRRLRQAEEAVQGLGPVGESGKIRARYQGMRKGGGGDTRSNPGLLKMKRKFLEGDKA